MLKAVKKAKAQVKDELINVVTNSRSTFTIGESRLQSDNDNYYH